MSKEYKLVTLEAYKYGLKCKLTQRVNTKYKWGHYNWVIEDLAGNILGAGSSAGGPPKVVNKDELIDKLDRFQRFNREETEESK